MSVLSLDATNRIYSTAGAATIKRHTVSHKGFHQFSRAVRLFEHELGENVDDSHWHSYLSRLRRYRFSLCAAPLPFSWHDSNARISLEELEQLVLDRSPLLYPSQAAMARDLWYLWRALTELDENPILEAIRGLLPEPGKGRAVIVVKGPRLVPAAEEVLRTADGLLSETRVMAAGELGPEVIADCMVVVGAPRWFPGHVFSVPRADEVHYVTYRWVAGRYTADPVFSGGVTGGHGGGGVPAEEADEEAPGDGWEFQADELIPSLNWGVVRDRIGKSETTEDDHDEIVKAKLLVLCGELATFVEVSDGGAVMVIDLEEEDERDEEEEDGAGQGRIWKPKATELRPGMFVLLRTEGSGDYVVPVANIIMKEPLATKARASQTKWKSLLRIKVWSRGLVEACCDLIDLGSDKANETNVRNWMSPRSIRPNADSDFFAIIKYVGLEGEYSDIAGYANAIRRAHLQAGQVIRRQLLAQVKAADLGVLRRSGQMEFELPDADGGSFTALRVEEIVREEFEVLASRLGEIFDLAGEW